MQRHKRLHVDLQCLHEGALDPQDDVVVATFQLRQLGDERRGGGGRLLAVDLVVHGAEEGGRVGEPHVARAVIEAVARHRLGLAPRLRRFLPLVQRRLHRHSHGLVVLEAAVGLWCHKKWRRLRRALAVDGLIGHAVHALIVLLCRNEGHAFHGHAALTWHAIAGVPQLLHAVCVATRRAGLAAAVTPPSAQFCLVDVVRGTELRVPVRELAPGVVALPAEEVVAQLRLREVRRGLQLLSGVRERARGGQGTLVLLVEDAQLGLVELLPDLRRELGVQHGVHAIYSPL
mmetsp:Transcript_26416/g.72574  ORF Transcript_26416/g.72574 Transcript_26416/m.72574 type:complete len:288 (+) Transcript_26416:167-1030(+)